MTTPTGSAESQTPTDLTLPDSDLDAAVTEALDGLDLNGEAPAVRKWAKGELVRRRLEPKIAALADTGADLPDLAAHSHDFRPDAAAATADWGLEGVTVRGSNTLLVSPTNAGGSSLFLHFSACFLTDAPVLGLWQPTYGPGVRVLWINPEEAENLPDQRLAAHGVTPDDTAEGRWLQIHTRDARLYFNRPRHVAHLLDHLDGEGWNRDDPRPVVVIIDGLQPTLAGDLWGADLEAWKEGVGQLRDHLRPEALYVRAQTTTWAARSSVKATKAGNGQVSGEDVGGGQIFQWPDHRLTLNRDGTLRRLNVRGRHPGQEGDGWDISYSRDDRGQLWAEEANARTWGVVRVNTYLSGTGWRTNEHTTGRSVADHLHEADQRMAMLNNNYAIVSVSTYRRVMEDWRHDPEADAWVPRSAK